MFNKYINVRYVGWVKDMRKNDNAVSPVISAVLALLVVSSTMASIIFWGAPYISELNEKTSRENAEQQLTSIGKVISDLAGSSSGERSVDTLSLGEGQIYTDADADRTIVTYSYYNNYNFTVSGLDTCFLAGTKVLIADGSYKNIEEMKIGDIVLSYDEISANKVPCKVSYVFTHAPNEMAGYYLLINNGLKVTPNHRFYSGGKWVCAGNLKVGDFLFSQKLDSNYQIHSIKKIYQREQSFDLEVENCHTYFVSIPYENVCVLVHNGDVSGGSGRGGEEGEPSAFTANAGGPHYSFVSTAVSFTGTYSESPTPHSPYTFLWDFGDGSTSTLQNPTYGYTTVGIYSVTFTVTCSQGHTATATTTAYIALSATDDSYMDSVLFNQNYGSDLVLKLDNIVRERAVIKFDLSGIPSGSTIESATLKLYYSSYETSPGNPPDSDIIECCKIYTSWSQSTVTWNSPWSNWGGDYITPASATAAIPGSTGQYMLWDVKNDVQDIVNGISINRGWLLKFQTELSGLRHIINFRSKEYSIANRPRLEISYIKCQTLESTGIKQTNATFNGKVNWDGGSGCQYRFLNNKWTTSGWGSDGSTSWTGSKKTGQSFSFNAPLTAGSLYRYRAEIRHSTPGLINYGEYKYLLTPGNITSFTATTANPFQINLSWTNVNNADGAYIEWDTSPHASWAPGNYNKLNTTGYCPGTSFKHTSLTPGSTYYYKAWAYAQDGQQDKWKSKGNATAPFGNYLTSNAVTQTLRVSTNESTGVLSTIANIHGYLTDPYGYSCTVWFQYGLTTSYGTNTSSIPKSTSGAFSVNLSNLEVGAKYHYRAVGQYSTGTGGGKGAGGGQTYKFFGQDNTFTTSSDGILVVSPKAEKWKRGTTHAIEWRYGIDVTGNVNITLWKGSQSWKLKNETSIGSGGRGSYNWSIPSDQQIGKYRINVSCVTDPSIYDNSEYFSITELYEGTHDNLTIYIIPPISGTPSNPGTGNIVLPQFTYAGKQTSQKSFSITMNEGTVNKAEVYWINYGKDIVAPLSLKGLICIDLYNGYTHFGSIWILDSDSITYEPSGGEVQKVIIENGGIINYKDGSSIIKQKPPYLYEGADIFSMHAVQTAASTFELGGTGNIRCRVYSNLYKNSAIEDGQKVFNFRLQFYGDNAEVWLNYFAEKYKFDYVGGSTLFYMPSSPEKNAISFSFAHASIKLDAR